MQSVKIEKLNKIIENQNKFPKLQVCIPVGCVPPACWPYLTL